jgi:pantetheine-phosphate adenylyltransferase
MISNLEAQKRNVECNEEWESLIMAAYFHDTVYVPGAKDNEERSVNKMMSLVKNPNDGVVLLAKKIILDGKKIEPKESYLFNTFQTADCWTLIHGSVQDLLVNENLIFKEFQRFPWDQYKKGRMDFLESVINVFKTNADNLRILREFVANRKPKIGVYAGSFNPFHAGHLNVVYQAEQVFDKVVIAYGTNPEKEKREVVFPKTISDLENVVYEGFLSDLLYKYEKMGCDVTLIRGLRNEYDLNYEQNTVSYIKEQKSDLKTVFFLCDKQYEHVSSGAIRQLQKFGDHFDKYIVS